MAEPLNTGLSSQQVLTAFDRALNDYTDDEINAMIGEKQNTVADIEAIRTGAANGTSAFQQVGIIGTQGAKNALEIESFYNQSGAEITHTWNESSGTIEVSGTIETSAMIRYYVNVTRPGTYIFSCGDESNHIDVDPDSSYYCGISKSGTTYCRDYEHMVQGVNNIATFTETGRYLLQISLRAGNTINTVFKPMLRLVEITDNTFTPYAPTNRELYEMIAALTARVEALENA